MSLFLLPFVSLAVASGQADAAPKSLASVLAHADAIVSYAIADHQVSFTIEEDGETFAVHATTRDDGTVQGVAIADVGRATGAAPVFSWLSRELDGVTITSLAVAGDGQVFVSTSSGERYELITAAGGNTAVSARWAAAWDE